MSSLITFVKKASKPSPAVDLILNFVEDLGEMEEDVTLLDNNSEEFKILLNRQIPFNPDKKVSRINDVVESFRSISKNSIDMYTLNSKLAIQFGIKYYALDETLANVVGITFKKMSNCVI